MAKKGGTFRKTLRVPRWAGLAFRSPALASSIEAMRRDHHRGQLRGVFAVIYAADGSVRLFGHSHLSLQETRAGLDDLMEIAEGDGGLIGIGI